MICAYLSAFKLLYDAKCVVKVNKKHYEHSGLKRAHWGFLSFLEKSLNLILLFLTSRVWPTGKISVLCQITYNRKPSLALEQLSRRWKIAKVLIHTFQIHKCAKCFKIFINPLSIKSIYTISIILKTFIKKTCIKYV